jgi:hypothetical protein
MLWIYLKISLALAIPLALPLYARQVRHDHDMQAVEWDVRHPPNPQWALTHPRESIQAYRAEAKYLQELIQDLNI